MYPVLDRFLKYVTYDTQSVDGADTVPSTPGQLTLAKALGEELRALGLEGVEVTEQAYVTAALPSNVKDPEKRKKVPSIGFIAHMDTATEVTGKDVRPRVVKDYDGGDILLGEHDGEKVVLSPRDFPYLADYKGQDLVVTDGRTLLGADNKAGIAEIAGGVEYLLRHPELEHGAVKIAFTPDEEVSHLAKLLDIEKFGADFASTLDGHQGARGAPWQGQGTDVFRRDHGAGTERAVPSCGNPRGHRRLRGVLSLPQLSGHHGERGFEVHHPRPRHAPF